MGRKIINYSEYRSQYFEDPISNRKLKEEINLLFESKGIPNILKGLCDSILEEISNGSVLISRDYDFDKFKTNIYIEIKPHSKKTIYAVSEFGIFTPIGNRLKEVKITIFLDKDNYDIIELKSVITHELLHIYEVYNRIINKTKKDIQWQLNNTLLKIRNKYDDDFINDFSYLIYLSMDQEINARVSETYTILIDQKNYDRDILINSLKLTNSWKYSEYLINFSLDKYNIDYDKLLNYLIDVNTLMNKKLNNLNFNIYKIPNNIKDCKVILKKWITLFKKKGMKFRSKLIKIIDEVINDVKMIDSAIFYNNKLKFDKLLERNSKILKLLRC